MKIVWIGSITCFILFNWFTAGFIKPSHKLRIKSSRNLLSKNPIEDNIRFYQVIDNQEVASKVPLLFIPGLDGVGNYSSATIGNLTEEFDVWRLAVGPSDRSSFLEVAQTVIGFMEKFKVPLVLVGESFGALVATYIAARKPSSVDRLVLVNPATGYQKTAWSTVGPLIASAGPAYRLLSIGSLLMTATPPDQFRRMFLRVARDVSSSADSMAEMRKMYDAMLYLLELLPADTLAWRLKKWLDVGSSVVEPRLKDVRAPTLVLVGENDGLLPSGQEGQRLKGLLSAAPQVRVRTYPNTGHVILDGTVDPYVLLKDLRRMRQGRAAFQVPLPTERDLKEAELGFGPVRNSTSPVFLSRDAGGSLVRGLGGVPTGLEGRPVLFVGNHQLYGLDMSLLISQFLREKNVLVRGLAHPMVFDGSASNQRMADTFYTFGAVEVSPISIFQLLKSNETVLLFPGGAREALHGKDEQYKLFWPEKTDFVRMAAMLDAIIVPFAAIGMADSLNVVFDANDIQDVPFLKRQSDEVNRQLSRARVGRDRASMTPFVLPGIPQRNYFLFQQPIDMAEVGVSDKRRCREVYLDVQLSVESGIDFLLEFRRKDPYGSFFRRHLFERAYGEQAPTAPLN